MLASCVIGLPVEFDTPLAAIDAAVEGLLDQDIETPTSSQHLALLRLECAGRRLSAAGTPAAVALNQHATAEEIADTIPMAIASALRISPDYPPPSTRRNAKTPKLIWPATPAGYARIKSASRPGTWNC
jgi:hypothetical protein